MARGQHRIADLRRQLENRWDDKRNQNWGHLLHPPYQRLRGHWERAWNCRGWPCHSPLVTIGNEVIFFYHGSTGMLWRTSQTRTSCWTQKILVPWKIFLRSAVIKLTSRMNGWANKILLFVKNGPISTHFRPFPPLGRTMLQRHNLITTSLTSQKSTLTTTEGKILW